MSENALEGAIQFALQSHGRLLAAQKVEHLVHNLRVPTSVQKSAELATGAAAVTLDEAIHELAETITDTIKQAVMTAVAAMGDTTETRMSA